VTAVVACWCFKGFTRVGDVCPDCRGTTERPYLARDLAADRGVKEEHMSLKEAVATNLKKTRTKKKLSQDALATKAGVSVSYVSMLERGQRSPPLDTLESLAKALEVPATALLRE